MRWARGFYAPRPSLFDLLVSGFLLAPYIERGTKQEVFFIFYVLMLWGTSLMIKPKRRFSSIPLALLCLWTMAGVFIHSFRVSEFSITRSYLNLYLMSEGFIYLLMGCVFIHLAVNYTRNLKFTLFLIPLSSISIFKSYIYGGQVSILGAFAVSILFYLAIRKAWNWFYISTGFIGLLCIINWQWIVMKFSCRPLIWEALSKNIMAHPFVGTGFNKTLSYDNMIYINIPGAHYGWTYNHNDFLSIGMFLGIPAIILSIWFTWSIIKRPVYSIMIIPAIALFLLCNVQKTMFDIGKASVILVMLSLIILQTLKKEEQCVS